MLLFIIVLLLRRRFAYPLFRHFSIYYFHHFDTFLIIYLIARPDAHTHAYSALLATIFTLLQRFAITLRVSSL